MHLRAAELDAVVTDLVAASALVQREQTAGLVMLAREEPIALGIPASAPEVVLHGRIDVLARRGGALVVQDYKYAEPSAAAAAEYGEQLAAYRLAVRRRTGEEVAGELVFVRGAPRIVALPPLDAARMEAALLAAGRGLAAVAGRRDLEAYPRGPESPDACERLGCELVRRCWSGGPGVIDSARDARPRTAAS
jgi:hypothetical protein